MKELSTVFKIFLVILLYLLLIGGVGWCLIKSYDFFLTNINKKVATQTSPLKSEINAINNLKATNPASLKDIQSYDMKNNTDFYNMVQDHLPLDGSVMAEAYMSGKHQMPPKEMIGNVLEGVIGENELKISDIEDKSRGFWSELPPWSTLLLTGIGIFLTSLITNFGIFCSGLITSFRKWILGKSSLPN